MVVQTSKLHYEQFLEQETLLLLLSTGWLQERIGV